MAKVPSPSLHDDYEITIWLVLPNRTMSHSESAGRGTTPGAADTTTWRRCSKSASARCTG